MIQTPPAVPPALPTGEPAGPRPNGELQELFHDVQGCLSAVAMGTELLRGDSAGDEHFTELCDIIDRERKRASELLRAYLDAQSQAAGEA